MSGKSWLTTGGIVGLMAVVFGAFGAHGIEEAIPQWYGESDLKTKSSETSTTSELDTESSQPLWYQLDQLHKKKLKTWITGVRYHFYHTGAILILGLLALISDPKHRKFLNISGWLFLFGIIGFSGSIYLYVLTKVKILGMTAALGGVILVAGWLFFVFGVAKSIQQKQLSSNSESQSSEA